MITRSVLTYVTVAMLGCSGLTGPSEPIVAIAVNQAAYVAGSAQGYAAVQLTISVTNGSGEPIEFLACGFRLQREVAGAFQAVYNGACTTPEPKRLLGFAEDTVTLSFQIESHQLDRISRYRASLPVAYGPDYRAAEPQFSPAFKFD
jgi:hypothetical protein